MDRTRFAPRSFWLLLADAAIVYGGIVLALYFRLGLDGADNELNARNGWSKIALATLICLLIFYFYDLLRFYRDEQSA